MSTSPFVLQNMPMEPHLIVQSSQSRDINDAKIFNLDLHTPATSQGFIGMQPLTPSRGCLRGPPFRV
ncbi:hypothetical protein FPOA_00475 [Fusarium poae]|uniref:Uncharacterized protein n=1 Tax=Fusarium poae TaxID=36050 RepID=A0A1B8B1D5_FUSPO|nr:hypothetical protein FPOA_00475 [Fusarium poae]